jgi:hypothetical protein
MNAIPRLLEAAHAAPRKRLPALTDDGLQERIERFLDDEWTVNDLMEMEVDSPVVELSTAASVGSGTDRGLGHEDDEDEKYEKILAQFEVYKRNQGLQEVRPNQVRAFAEGMGLPERLGEGFLEYLRKIRNVG